MRTQEHFNSAKTNTQTRNNALAIYIASITLLVVSYSVATAVTVL